MKDITPRNRIWVKPTDQMDVWLDTQGFYRKHTARDGTCLFRAVSEQIFLTQAFHNEVRRQIADFILLHSALYQDKITCPVLEYVERMRNPREWGGKLEIDVMAQLYRYDFILYQEIGKPPEAVTHYGFKDKVVLCYSQEHHFDSVYTKDFISTAAFCQSMIYELLYKKVFELQEVDYAVNKMLHDKTSRYQRDHLSILNTGFALSLEMRDSYLNVKALLDIGITPFPYKVAKSLDPEVYRNVEYDTWNDYRKGLRYGFCAWNCRELQVGVKCLVKLDEGSYHGHIQDMQPNKGPVVVFIEELGEKLTVCYDRLELLPVTTPPDASSRPSLPLKFQLPVPLAKAGKKLVKYTSSRGKLGDTELSKVPKCSKELSRGVLSPETSIVNGSDYYDQELDYQQGVVDTYPQVYTTQREGEGEEEEEEEGERRERERERVIEEERCPDSTKPGLGAYNQHQPEYQHQPTPLHVNLMAPRSLNSDGSDLPHTDIPTLRFFYNLGLDHLRMNYVFRPGPPYYVSQGVLPPGYVTVETPCLPAFDPQHNISNQIVGETRRAEYLASPLVSTEHESSQLGLPPRFKNRAKPSPVKRNSSLYEGAPLIQQCEVSSSTGGGAYYPLECDPYCMYVEPYTMYDYPQPVYPQPTFPPPEPTLFYPHILPPGISPPI